MPDSTPPSHAARPELTAEAGQRSLLDHATEKAFLARARHGEAVDAGDLTALLADRAFVRYPTRITFSAEGLGEGRFAAALPLGARPAEGYVVAVHPHFAARPRDVALLVAYHLVAVNYGEIADASVAERFGATLCGRTVDDYYARLCSLADELA